MGSPRVSPSAMSGGFACLAALANALPGQCTHTWESMGTLSGIVGTAYATTEWDPDGPGPATSLLVIGGWFSAAGNLTDDNLVAFDPSSNRWISLGGGVNGSVHALATLPNGNLVVGGQFTATGGVPAASIAQWNGSTWSPLGIGIAPSAGAVYALAAMPDGSLVAGGYFSSAGGASANSVVRWNGSSWSSLGAGFTQGVNALAVLPSGELWAGGSGGARVSRWDGLQWTAVGLGTNGAVLELLPLPNGDVIAAGTFTSAGGAAANRVARWNGAAWSALGSGVDEPVEAIDRLPNGDLIAGGRFPTQGGSSAGRVARWNGTAWSSIGTITGSVYSLKVLGNGRTFVGGDIYRADGVAIRGVAEWSGAQWSSLGSPALSPSAIVRDFLTLRTGAVVATGDFTSLGTQPVNHIAVWDGNSWAPLGSGLNGPGYDLLELTNGQIVVAGAFTTAGGIGVDGIARWDGTAWHAFGTGLGNNIVQGVAQRPNGELLAAGSIAGGVRRWNGTTWSSIGFNSNGVINAIASLPNGDIVVGGSFLTISGQPMINVARWDGSTWWPMGDGIGYYPDQVNVLMPLPNGDLFAAGQFATPSLGNGVARWNGTSWLPVSSGPPSPGTQYVFRDAAVLPDGDIVVADPQYGLFRHGANGWSSLGGAGQWGTMALAMDSNGHLLVGGHFTSIGGVVSPILARLISTCPGNIGSLGAGCVGSGGTNSLTASSQPWLESSFRARAEGLAPGSLAIATYAFGTTALPLSALLPQGGTGCILYVPGDIATLAIASNGTVDTTIAIPNISTLIGATFHHQVMPVELDAAANILAVTSTNALSLTIGLF